MKDSEHIPIILVVDDEEGIRSAMKRIIELSGFRSFAAEGPSSAIAILDDYPVDVVITDIGMPEMSGIDLCKIIKERYQADVIFISRYVEDFNYEEINEIGASEFMTKPVRMTEAIARLKRILNYRKIKNSFEKLQTRLHEDQKDRIIRSIEFPPEYFQAGISILNLFGSVLNKKHPDQKAKISVEQEGLKVRLIIDPIDGDREVLEKALVDYGLVVTGKISPEKYTDDKILILELKTNLRFCEALIESQKEIIAYQKSDIADLKDILKQALIDKPTNIEINVPIEVSAQSEIKQTIAFKSSIQMMKDSFCELSKQSNSDSKEKDRINDIIDATNELNDCKSKEEIKNSPALAKIKKFIEDIEKAGSWANKIVITAENGFGIGQKIIKGYGILSKLCGFL